METVVFPFHCDCLLDFFSGCVIEVCYMTKIYVCFIFALMRPTLSVFVKRCRYVGYDTCACLGISLNIDEILFFFK